MQGGEGDVLLSTTIFSTTPIIGKSVGKILGVQAN